MLGRSRKGDDSSRNRLVEANLRFVVSVAKEYQNRGVPLADLISAGNMGLITAAERFDENKGFKFISYAVWWIRQAILQTLAEQSPYCAVAPKQDRFCFTRFPKPPVRCNRSVLTIPIPRR